ncbi:acyl--CoA ligase [bacterium]|nr:acyl--CoA ligase [bacterium]
MREELIQRHWLFSRIREHDKKPFLVYGGKEYTYDELGAEVDRMTEAFENAGIGSGCSVALISDFSFKSISCLLALFGRRNLVTPVTVSSEAEIADRILESYADFSIALNSDRGDMVIESIKRDRDYHGLIEAIFNDAHAGLILFSSGTTGKPKAMVHDLDQFLQQYENKRARSLSILVFLMFDHIGGLNTLFNALMVGAKMVVPMSRDASEVASLIQDHKVNVLPTSPTFLNLMLIEDAPNCYNLSSLRIITYGTEPMPESLLHNLKTAFPKVKLLQTFGTSETGITQTVSKSSSSLLMKLDDPNVEYRIVDGELWLKSGTQIKGYLNHSMEQFTDDGWFRTGDLVEETSDGFLRVIGRNSDIINVGGEKVFPAEVESILMEMPEVLDCLVLGRSNAITGQAICAQIVVRSGVEKRELKRAIRSFCRCRLANFKIPQIIEVVEKTNVGSRFKKLRKRLN